MDFFDNVMNKSNAIIKERLNNPFGGKQSQEMTTTTTTTTGQETTSSTATSQDDATPFLESTAREQHQQLNSQDSMTSNTSQSNNNNSNNNPDQNNGGDKNSQFAAIAADAEAVAQKAAKGAKNIGTFLFSMANKAGQTVSQTAKQVKQAVESTSILTDFTREQQEFIREHGGSLQAGQLPWEQAGCDEQAVVVDESRVAYIKEQILSLSQDKRNFVRSPPGDADFKFDPQSCYPMALSLLKEDPNLNKMRYELVPKLVNEDTFWCNYFYRVTMLKQMSEKGTSAKQGWSSSRSSSGEGPDEVSSMTPHGTIDEPSSPGYMTSSDHHKTTPQLPKPTHPPPVPPKKQDSFKLDRSSTSFERQQSSSSTTVPTKPPEQQQQYQEQELESSESRKLFAEADDLKSKLRELNIGSLDGNDDEWDEELQQDLQEFELVSGGDLGDALDEEFLQTDIMQQQETTGAVNKQQDKKTS